MKHFRMIGVLDFPQPGVQPSEILSRAMPQLTAFEKTLPAGYRMQIGGEQAKQQAGFANLARVSLISILGSYAALLLQFGNAVKPFLVLAAAPYGVVGAGHSRCGSRTPAAGPDHGVRDNPRAGSGSLQHRCIRPEDREMGDEARRHCEDATRVGAKRPRSSFHRIWRWLPRNSYRVTVAGVTDFTQGRSVINCFCTVKLWPERQTVRI